MEQQSAICESEHPANVRNFYGMSDQRLRFSSRLSAGGNDFFVQ